YPLFLPTWPKPVWFGFALSLFLNCLLSRKSFRNAPTFIGQFVSVFLGVKAIVERLQNFGFNLLLDMAVPLMRKVLVIFDIVESWKRKHKLIEPSIKLCHVTHVCKNVYSAYKFDRRRNSLSRKARLTFLWASFFG